MKKILTIGSALKDHTFLTSNNQVISNQHNLIAQKLLAFEFGAKINIQEAYFTYGGGAANVATSLTKLGAQCSILTCLGQDDLGQEIINNLKKNAVRTNLIQHSLKPSPIAFVINETKKAGEHVDFIYRGSNEDLKINLDNIFKKQSRVSGIKTPFDLIYLTSLSGRLAKNNLAEIFKAKINFPQLLFVWNPGSEQIKLGLPQLKIYLAKTDLLFLNKDEAIELCLEQEKKQNLNNPRILLKILTALTPGLVVITDGERGSYAGEKNKIFFCPSQKVTAKDTLGVGDAFGSAFTASYFLKKLTIEKSLALGIKNALAVIKQFGAENGLLNQKELYV